MSESANGDGPGGLAYQPVPPTPWEIFYKSSVRYYEPEFDDAGELVHMDVVTMPAMPVPGMGPMPMPPAVRVRLSAEGWERLKVEVANDGKRHRPSGLIVAGSDELPDGGA